MRSPPPSSSPLTHNNATVDTPPINNHSPFSFLFDNTSLLPAAGDVEIFRSRACGLTSPSSFPLVALRHIAPITSYPLIHLQKVHSMTHPLLWDECKERLSLSHQRFALNTQHNFKTKTNIFYGSNGYSTT